MCSIYIIHFFYYFISVTHAEAYQSKRAPSASSATITAPPLPLPPSPAPPPLPPPHPPSPHQRCFCPFAGSSRGWACPAGGGAGAEAEAEAAAQVQWERCLSLPARFAFLTFIFLFQCFLSFIILQGALPEPPLLLSPLAAPAYTASASMFCFS